ncbi:MAG: dephospho-CoA kinase [Bryobacterales bacterium]|nr:dephospho-CoA kinase [Bryobacterales bacterium]MDE0620911.1 dephospho-CoA kinase [Bryobacterales bacterium]
MLRVGLTGGLASGKSFAASEFERLGCVVLQADRLGHAILAEDAVALGQVTAAFGEQVLGADGAIDRKALARVVFASKDELERLNAIVHPRVFERVEDFFRRTAQRDPDAVALVEAAIMVETGSYRRYDRLVLAACPREAQIDRFVQREGATRAEAEARLGRQMPLDEKRKYADYVIDTGGSEARTLEQVREVYRHLRDEAEKKGALGDVQTG